MPCSASRRSVASLHFSGSPTNTGTMWVSLAITGRPAAVSTALTRPARSWWRSRSKLEVLRWRIAALAAAVRAVHADRVHLVRIGHGAMALGQVANAVDRRHVAVHGIERLEHDQLRPPRPGSLQQLFKMRHVVVAENLLLALRLPHAFDHRIVVEGIRQDQAVRHQLGDGRDAGLVRDVARGEDQRRFLAVQVGELALELDQRMIGAGDVAGAAGAGAHAGRGLDHGADHLGVLAHAEIVVGAPYDYVPRPLRRMPDRAREPPGLSFEVGKNPIAPLVLEPAEGVREKHVIIHRFGLPGSEWALFGTPPR